MDTEEIVFNMMKKSRNHNETGRHLYDGRSPPGRGLKDQKRAEKEIKDHILRGVFMHQLNDKGT